MKWEWLNRKAGNERLVLFFNGWGQDVRAVGHLSPVRTDVLMLYAYHSGKDFDLSLLKDYAVVDLAAWSMGVWFAAREVDGVEWNIRRAVALCGTESAIDDMQGIPRAIFDATLSGLSPRSLEKFSMRMAGGVAAYRQGPLARPGSRDFDEVRAELQWWKDHCRPGTSGKKLRWEKALVGSGDAIFPPGNQCRAWEKAGVPLVQRDCPHYPFGGMVSWDEVFGF